MTVMNVEAFLEPIILSLKVTLFSSILAFLLGGVCAWFMTYKKIRAKILIETFFMLPLVLPPTVIGLVLLIVFGKNSLVGAYLFRLFDSTILFTWWAAVIASMVVAFPLVYNTIKIGLQTIDQEFLDVGRTLGANEWQIIKYVTIPLIAPALMTSFILAFARGLGEFGATIMVAGNIPGKTQTIATAIYSAVEMGDFQAAIWWSVSIIVISFSLLLLSFMKNFTK